MNKLEKLMADHAYWSSERNRLKREGAEEYAKCTSSHFDGHHRITCLENAYTETRESAKENDYGQIGWGDYEVVLEEEGCCQHCARTRELKRQRAYAGQRLGAVRSAITRAGKRILAEQDNNRKNNRS